MRICAGCVKVRDSVVCVVFVLPPPHAETLHQVTPENARQVAVRSVFEHLQRQEREGGNETQSKGVSATTLGNLTQS